MKLKLFIIFLLAASSTLFSDSLGVLTGKNIYLPFIPYYSFPGADPVSHPDSWRVDTQYYLVNDIMVIASQPEETDEWVKADNSNLYLIVDYECSIWEQSLSRDWGKKGKAGLTLRLFSYRSGKGDLLIDRFHETFSFPDANRSDFPVNQLYINLSGTSGYHLYLNKPVLAFGDTDIHYQKPLWNDGLWMVSLGAALKLPTGSPETLSGSRRPDIGIQAITVRHGRIFHIHLQSGWVLPLAMLWPDESSPRISCQNLVGFEYPVTPSFSILAQMHVNTSFIQSPYYRSQSKWNTINVFESPQTNLRIGFILEREKCRFQFYFEEDPFTGEGSDIILNLGLSVFR